MRLISEKQALEKLCRLKAGFAERISSDFEHRAKSCMMCETPGACCLDAHFVNVRISRLEAGAIRNRFADFPAELRERVRRRIDDAIEKYDLDETGDGVEKTYACPLFEKNIGCLVHSEGKPLPCIQHACYENENDLPPDELLAEQEGLVDQLNRRVYGNGATLLPIPVALASLEK